MYLFFDTETNDLPKDWKKPVEDLENWPRMIQLAYLLYDEDGKEIEGEKFYIKPNGFVITEKAFKTNGLTLEKLEKEGVELKEVLKKFQKVLDKADFLIAHNISFDENIIGAEFLRNKMKNGVALKTKICTMLTTVDFCAIPGNFKGQYKWPKLSELYNKIFNKDFENGHDAMVDVRVMSECFFELLNRNLI